MIRVKGYFSASIRGKAGEKASQTTMDRNIFIGNEMGQRVRRLCGSVLQLYIPHEQDQVIQYLWRRDLLTTKQVLAADLSIVEAADLLLVWEPLGFISGGMKVEIDGANRKRIPIIEFRRLNDRTIGQIIRTVSEIYDRKT